MTPEELERRATPILPVIEEFLSGMERDGAALIVDRKLALTISAGFMLAFLDKRHSLPKGVLKP